MRPGEHVEFVDRGVRLRARVEAVVDGRLEAAVEEETPLSPEPARITLAVGMPKGKKLEEVVRAAVELGVSRVIPVYTSRSVPRPGERWQRAERLSAIALEAAQQSGRGVVPEVSEPVSFAAYIMHLPPGQGVVLWEGEREAALVDVIRISLPDVTLFVGPEGGLSTEEVTALVKNGYKCARIGTHILRAETACLATVAVVAALAWAERP